MEVGALTAPVAGAASAGAVELNVEVASRNSGIDVTGTIEVPWTAECRRCLEPIHGRTVVQVDEIFERRPTSDDRGPISVDGTVDLGPMIHDEALCALPLTVLCDGDCRGPVPEVFDDGHGSSDGEETEDPRWAALEGLSFDD